MEDRFHVLVGEACNNNCLFCMEHNGRVRTFGEARVTPERIRGELERYAGCGEVMFASGEPTLSQMLPQYVRWARELGFRRIGLTTNGRRLGYEEYCRHLLESGLNHLVISVHGPDARTHDAQTRAPGSFEQTRAGLEVLARLRGRYRFSLHSSTVVGRRNYQRLADLHAFLLPFGLDQHVFNVMQPLGRAGAAVPTLLARYADVVREFGRFLAALPARGPLLYLVDLPPCTSEALPAAVRGWVEYAFFTSFDDRGRGELRQTRVHKDRENRVKRPACARCRYDGPCLGVWRAYVDAFGWDEFEPVAGVTGAATPRSSR